MKKCFVMVLLCCLLVAGTAFKRKQSARRLRNFDGQCKARNRRHRKGLQESRRE
ncbi:MAG: hypothetical protein ACLR7Z_20375 [Bilophila wadsworthia]